MRLGLDKLRYTAVPVHKKDVDPIFGYQKTELSVATDDWAKKIDGFGQSCKSEYWKELAKKLTNKPKNNFLTENSTVQHKQRELLSSMLNPSRTDTFRLSLSKARLPKKTQSQLETEYLIKQM